MEQVSNEEVEIIRQEYNIDRISGCDSFNKEIDNFIKYNQAINKEMISSARNLKKKLEEDIKRLQNQYR